ncbi:MAG: peptidylprolyl isomerase [Deltaproteobacteria bacterium]|nr:peptidylprolyl isomerase [Deltaproteobacteria bacterium]
MRFFRLIALLGVCLVLGGMAPQKARGQDQGEKGNDKVLARVDDMVITVRDLEHMISLLPAYYLTRPGSKEVNKKALLDKLINEMLIEREAKKLNLEQRQDYQQRRKSLLRELMVDVFLKKLREDKDTEANQRRFYEENIDRYSYPEEVHIAIINLQKSKEESEVIFKMAEAGKDFAELARTYSVSPTAKKGGDMGWRSRRELSDALSEVVFSMKKGQIKGPIKDRGGYVIVKLLDHKKTRPIPFERIRTKIYNDYALKLRDDEIARLRKAAEISVDGESLKRVRVRRG